jgi:hypothetical protein
MGFIHDPEEIEACLGFVEAHSPFRFCLLAVGAPQQEAVAQLLKARGIARGLTLCIGASINFLTGDERRAPLWMQRCGMEWSFRLMRSPGRLATRYLVRGPRVFGLLSNAEIVLRKTPTPILQLVPALHRPALPAAPPPEPARLVQAERHMPAPNQPPLPAASPSEPARLAHAERRVPAPNRPALPAASPSEPARLAHAERENRAVSATI